MSDDVRTLLIVEDDEALGSCLLKGLTESGYRCCLTPTGSAAKQLLNREKPDLVLLDLSLPDSDGIDLLKRIRSNQAELPVIITTARSDISDRVHALELGADDYLVKPFVFEELLARIRVQLRHAERVAVNHQIGDLVIDEKTRAARRGNRVLSLTSKEFDLLAYLASLHGKTATRDMLCEHVWKIQTSMTSVDNAIDVQISRLRKKLTGENERQLLHTVRGIGFSLKEEA